MRGKTTTPFKRGQMCDAMFCQMWCLAALYAAGCFYRLLHSVRRPRTGAMCEASGQQCQTTALVLHAGLRISRLWSRGPCVSCDMQLWWASKRVQQRFLERGPAVMLSTPPERSRNGGTLIVRSSSHEVSTCMRTRVYHCASFVLHKGCASNQGHYLAKCWNGSVCYIEYNDDVIKDVTWQDIATKQVQGEAYV